MGRRPRHMKHKEQHKWPLYKDSQAMISAIQAGHGTTVQALIEQFGDRILNFPTTMHWTDETGRSFCPIHIAVECGSLAMVTLLLEAGAKPTEIQIDTNWNSRADQYLEHKTYTLEEWARRCNASNEIIELIRQA